jgi:hypothetical protein
MLRDQLGMPPLCITPEAILRLLGEQDLGRRAAHA